MDDAANRIVYCPEDWAKHKEEELIPLGYIFLEKAKSDLRYLGIPVYFRLSGFTVIDVSDNETAKKYGLPRANRIGSSALHDFLKSNTLSRFMAGFTKVGFAPIDVKMLMVVAPIVIGVIIGMAYFMGWFK